MPGACLAWRMLATVHVTRRASCHLASNRHVAAAAHLPALGSETLEAHGVRFTEPAIPASTPSILQVAAVHLHPEPFSVENGMMTPTFKLKRPQAQTAFQHAIDGAWAAPPPLLLQMCCLHSMRMLRRRCCCGCCIAASAAAAVAASCVWLYRKLGDPACTSPPFPPLLPDMYAKLPQL